MTSARKSVFITGAAAGIGRATAVTFARKGFTVGSQTKAMADGSRLSPGWLTRLVNKSLAHS